jgi:hypothetical protein
MQPTIGIQIYLSIGAATTPWLMKLTVARRASTAAVENNFIIVIAFLWALP